VDKFDAESRINIKKKRMKREDRIAVTNPASKASKGVGGGGGGGD